MESVISIYVMIVIVFGIGSLIDVRGDVYAIPFTPNEIYESSNINMFGCVLLFIIFVVFDPLFILARFLYWIFHVGRK